MNDAVLKSFLTGAAILCSSGPLAMFFLLPMAWNHLLDGESYRAAGLAVVAIINAAIFGFLVYGAIDVAYRAGIKRSQAQDRMDD